MTLSTIEAVYRNSNNLGDSNMTARERSWVFFSFSINAFTCGCNVCRLCQMIEDIQIFRCVWFAPFSTSSVSTLPLHPSRQDTRVLIYSFPSPVSFTLSSWTSQYIPHPSTHSHPLHHQAWLLFSYFPKECTHFDHLFAQILGNERLPSRREASKEMRVRLSTSTMSIEDSLVSQTKQKDKIKCPCVRVRVFDDDDYGERGGLVVNDCNYLTYL